MDRETVDQVLALVAREGIELLDLTGGAPELNPHFRYLVAQAQGAGRPGHGSLQPYRAV